MKLFKQYLMCVIVIMCCAALPVCCTIAESRTRQLSLGEKPAVYVLSIPEGEAGEIIKNGGKALGDALPHGGIREIADYIIGLITAEICS